MPILVPDDLDLEDIQLAINTISSSTITQEKRAIGQFARQKLKKLPTWREWQAGEWKQLDQFADLKMYGAPEKRPNDAIVLRPHWQYQLKQNGTRRARNCCDGSQRAAPRLHQITKTTASCVEQPVQRLFFGISAHLGYQRFGGDAQDAYAHSLEPTFPCYISIDDAYSEWYKQRTGEEVDRSMVLCIQHVLQGHPESGRLWEHHINHILASTDLGFKSTTHDKCIYKANFEGTTVYLLGQVDDFALATAGLANTYSCHPSLSRHSSTWGLWMISTESTLPNTVIQ